LSINARVQGRLGKWRFRGLQGLQLCSGMGLKFLLGAICQLPKSKGNEKNAGFRGARMNRNRSNLAGKHRFDSSKWRPASSFCSSSITNSWIVFVLKTETEARQKDPQCPSGTVNRPVWSRAQSLSRTRGWISL
jgi:hypothetical protein